jgi:Rrf2 family protein
MNNYIFKKNCNFDTMLSQKSKYALQALGYIAAHQNSGPVLMPLIAEKKRIPLRFLENIMHELKQEGFLTSFRGRHGGYKLAKPPEEIRLADIIRLVNGPIAMLSCVSLHFYQPCEGCTQDSCGLHDTMIEARDAILSILEGRTVADIMDKT